MEKEHNTSIRAFIGDFACIAVGDTVIICDLLDGSRIEFHRSWADDLRDFLEKVAVADGASHAL